MTKVCIHFYERPVLNLLCIWFGFEPAGSMSPPIKEASLYCSINRQETALPRSLTQELEFMYSALPYVQHLNLYSDVNFSLTSVKCSDTMVIESYING